MIENFDDFCLWVYVIVDDKWQQIASQFDRPGPAPLCSDSELLTMVLVGECRGWMLETDLLSHWCQHPDLFPNMPLQSCLNRRRGQLQDAIGLIHQMLLRLLDLADDRYCVIDSLPVPVVQFHLAPRASSEWAVHGATFGKVTSKKQTIYGYKLHLLTTLNGIVVDFILAPANKREVTIGVELLSAHSDCDVFGDKSYISAPIAEQLANDQRVYLHTIPRLNQGVQATPERRRLHRRVRQIIETVNSHLSQQFKLAQHHAHTFWDLCTRLLSKLTAHTVSIYINRLLGREWPLQIKSLALTN